MTKVHLYFIFIFSLLPCLLSAPAPAPRPEPLGITIHWQAKATGNVPKKDEDVAAYERLEVELKKTTDQIGALVKCAHVDKVQECRDILHELAGPEASITTINKMFNFLSRYVLRVYEWNFKNTGSRKKTLAHISANPLSDRMSISRAFWKKSIDEQVGILFHEASHRAGTIDWWKEQKNGKITPMMGEPTVKKEGGGRLMGYRHHSYWKIYANCGSKFVYNADFWYALAIYVRRANEGYQGDERYPLSLRKSHPEMSQRLTPQQQAIALEDPVPTWDNDGYEGVVEAEEQFPYYNTHPVPDEPDPHVAGGPSDRPVTPPPPGRTDSLKSVNSYNPEIPEPRPATPELEPEPAAAASSSKKKDSKKKEKEKKPESLLTNFLLGGSSRKKKKN